MTKLIENHRRNIGDFEVVEFVDTDEIERLRGQIDIEAPVNVALRGVRDPHHATLRA